MSLLDNIKISFGEGVTDADAASFYSYTILDDSINPVDLSGNAKSSFNPGETVNIITQLKPGWAIDRIDITDGEYLHRGTVSRTYTQNNLFFVDTVDGMSLTFYPSGKLTGGFYGRSCTFEVTDRSVVASAAPVIVDVSYPFSGHSISITPPSLTLGVGDSYPIGIVITVVKT